MGRTSTIEQMPQEILDKLQTLLRDPRISQLEATAKINTVLESLGHEVVSKSAVNRYAQKMERVGQKLRESREVAKMYIDRFGEDQSGEVGKLVNEMIRTMVFDITLKMQGETIDPDMAPELAKMIKNLSLSMQQLENAAAINSKREQEIKRIAAKEAAEAAVQSMTRQGMSKATVDTIKRDILGIAN
ncbi:DUF3486 family protein [Thiomicrorhabdus sp. Kp2]|uniref:DUF3486 family protein n=1 Tax=Thiomicrorhabdus sp. Kp2 TaxID=1123518 RepID=UPI000428B3AD|nr:DUF3486 family protein [Thiomicrorhabdus sp. Kp2]